VIMSQDDGVEAAVELGPVLAVAVVKPTVEQPAEDGGCTPGG
jgi:hypothetical protein